MASVNARAQLLFCSLNLLFRDVLVPVVVVDCLSSLLAELLRAEGIRAEPHTLENLVTHRSEKRLTLRTYVRPYANNLSSTN